MPLPVEPSLPCILMTILVPFDEVERSCQEESADWDVGDGRRKDVERVCGDDIESMVGLSE